MKPKHSPADEIVARAKARCAKHIGGAPGFCQVCFRAELEQHLARQNPTMDRDDITELVDAWMLAADSRPHLPKTRGGYDASRSLRPPE